VTLTSARGVARAALRNWRTKKEFADAVISNPLSKSGLQAADRAFALELFYGVLRNLSLLDFWIASLRKGPIETDLRDVLRLGLYQLFIAKTREHAAVNETVELASKKQRAIVNGMLRSAIRGRSDLLRRARTQTIDIRLSHPKFLVDRWEKNFGTAATAALCEWNNRPPPIYARVNRLKIDRESFLAHYCGSRVLPRVSNFVELQNSAQALAAGHCYIQDRSTAVACELLAPEPGEKVLDACAAPGGKTSYLAELMQNQGTLIAADRDLARLSLLKENLDRLGVSIANVVHQDWTERISREIASQAPFDRILIDAPCSNTGVMRRRVDVRWRLKPADFSRMQARQIEIVRVAAGLLKPGGTLVYSTCSLEPEENEQVVTSLLGKISTMQLEDEHRSLPFRDHFDGAFVARMRQLI